MNFTKSKWENINGKIHRRNLQLIAGNIVCQRDGLRIAASANKPNAGLRTR